MNNIDRRRKMEDAYALLRKRKELNKIRDEFNSIAVKFCVEEIGDDTIIARRKPFNIIEDWLDNIRAEHKTP